MSRAWPKHIQSQFLKKCSELLEQGFSLQETLQFLQYVFPHYQDGIIYIEKTLNNGERLDTALEKMGYAKRIISQIYLSQEYGQFTQVLCMCSDQIALQNKHYQQLKKVLVYPCLLLLVVLFLLLGIRQFFLPQLDRLHGNKLGGVAAGTVFFIRYFPFVVLFFVLLVMCIVGIGGLYYKKASALSKSIFLSKLPGIHRWIKLYYTGYFCQELGQLYRSEFSLNQIVDVLSKGNTSVLLKEFAVLLNAHAKNGETLGQVILKLPFLREEMAAIIDYGEKISQLSIKLLLYSQECFDRLSDDMEKKMMWIQPILFFLIGIVILLLYVTLMLPMLETVNQLFRE